MKRQLKQLRMRTAASLLAAGLLFSMAPYAALAAPGDGPGVIAPYGTRVQDDTIGTLSGVPTGTVTAGTILFLDGISASQTGSEYFICYQTDPPALLPDEWPAGGTGPAVTVDFLSAGVYDVSVWLEKRVDDDVWYTTPQTFTLQRAPGFAALYEFALTIGGQTYDGVIDGTNVTVTVPAGTDVTSATAVYKADAKEVRGLTPGQDFTDTVPFEVLPSTMISTLYTVTVVRQLAPPAVTPASLSLREGETGTFAVSWDVYDPDITMADITIESLHEDIATVDKTAPLQQGDIVTVTGVKAGTATIRVQFDGTRYKDVTVTVRAPLAAPAVTPSSFALKTGMDGTLTLNWDGEDPDIDPEKITVTSGNPSVVQIGTQTVQNPGDTVAFSTLMAGSATIRVQFDETRFVDVPVTVQDITVFFDNQLNDVTNPDSQTVAYGKPYGTLPAPKRSGYTLDGWYTASSGGTRITSSTLVSNENNHTLYARWSRESDTKTYAVIFETNGGTPIKQINALEGSIVQKPADPTRYGYTFTGWYTDAALTKSFSFPVTMRSYITLYAGWERNGEDHASYMSGYPDGTFRPENSMTRAEAASMFAAIMDLSGSASSYVPSFSDTPAGAWYYEDVMELARRGVLGGYSDGTFRPDAPVTRAEFTAIALRVQGITPGSSAASFSDVPSNHWATADIAAAVRAGLVQGYAGNTFRPEANITRAEAVTLANRMLGCTGSSTGRSFTDMPSNHWAYPAIRAATTNHSH